MTDTSSADAYKESSSVQKSPAESDQAASDYDSQKASQFIAETSLEDMIEIADEAVRRKRQEQASEGPKWVFPEDGIPQQ